MRGVRVDGQERLAIAASVSCRIRFSRLPLLPDSRLEFVFGVDAAAGCASAGPVRFGARLEGEGGARSWTGVSAVAGVFASGLLDLGSIEGSTGEIVLETSAPGNEACGTALWVQPRLRSSGRSIPLADRPVERLRPLVDLSRLAGGGGRGMAIGGLPQVVPGSRPRSPLTGGEGVSSSPVTFIVEQAGEVRLRRTLRAGTGRGSFQSVVVLPPADGTPDALRFRIEAEPLALAAARWTQATLHRVERTARLPAPSGPNLLLLVVDTLRGVTSGVRLLRPTSPNLGQFAAQSVVRGGVSQSSWTQPATATLLTGLYPMSMACSAGAGPAIGISRDASGRGSPPRALGEPVIGRGSGYDAGSETFGQAPFARADAVREGSSLAQEGSRAARSRISFSWIRTSRTRRPAVRGHLRRVPGRAIRRAGRARARNTERPAGITAADLRPRRANDEEIRSGTGVRSACCALGAWICSTGRSSWSDDHGEGSWSRPIEAWAGCSANRHVPLLIRARAPSGGGAARWSALPGARSRSSGWAPGRRTPPSRAQRGGSAHAFAHLPALGDGAHRPSLVSVRDTNWKLIRALDRDDSAMLFDLAADPGERHDVAALDPARANDYRARLRLWLERGAARGAVPLDPDLMERLQALGYVH